MIEEVKTVNKGDNEKNKLYKEPNSQGLKNKSYDLTSFFVKKTE